MLMVMQLNLSDRMSSQVPRSFLNILIELDNAVIRMFSARPPQFITSPASLSHRGSFQALKLQLVLP